MTGDSPTNQPTERICPQCGQPLALGRMAICNNCGARLVPERRPPRIRARLRWFVGVWLLFGIVITLAATPSFSGPAFFDPGNAEVLIFAAPILAFVAALVAGVILTLLAVLEWIETSITRALGSTILGLVGGPVLYLGLLALLGFVGSVLRLEMSSQVGPVLVAALALWVPLTCGVAATLLPTTQTGLLLAAALLPRQLGDAVEGTQDPSDDFWSSDRRR